ncbi:hypothetical protein H8F06_21370 [Vibrio fluvialis]|uniref:hypothetical protein n=1 Tax=Vibrio fluvialis TaxID=676 RepID=UPI00192A8B44|nr:hypothetical protein [Vibrio fluvialis]MBL4297832.1 hypothetical protein [Vibrio fluvialis]
MKLSHRRKRDHKAKVRRHAWKSKYETLCRRVYKELAEVAAHAMYRAVAAANGQLCAMNTARQVRILLADPNYRLTAMYRTSCRESFLTGYDHVMNDRRYDKEFKAATLDREKARAVDYDIWSRHFFNERVHADIQFEPGEDVEVMKSPEPIVYCGSARAGKTRLWDRAKAKVASWFGGSSLKKQSL